MRELNSLYYPFSRVKEISSLKQFLMLYDQTTFLDPVSDEGWRANLFKNLESQNSSFKSYSDLADNFPTLISEGVVRITDPQSLSAQQSPLTIFGIASDLADQRWMEICNPKKFNLPHQISKATGQPTWQTFLPKIPKNFLDLCEVDEKTNRHIISRGGGDHAWDLTYAAGSAIALNLHMAAAEELGLQLVTDSPLHNYLLLAKSSRIPDSEITGLHIDDKAEYIASGTMMKIMEQLFPSQVLDLISTEQLLIFRERSKKLRREFAEEISQTVKGHDALHGDRGDRAVQDISQKLVKDLKLYGDDLASVRDGLWPRLVGASIGPTVTGTSAAGYTASYISGSGFVMAASVILAALSPMKALMEYRADLKKVKRSASSSMAFLLYTQGFMRR